MKSVLFRKKNDIKSYKRRAIRVLITSFETIVIFIAILMICKCDTICVSDITPGI